MMVKFMEVSLLLSTRIPKWSIPSEKEASFTKMFGTPFTTEVIGSGVTRLWSVSIASTFLEVLKNIRDVRMVMNACHKLVSGDNFFKTLAIFNFQRRLFTCDLTSGTFNRSATSGLRL